mmetsp:Transcript_37997/g.119266  ORF Transcript_37997/g.119266 Transcript_37997/m.119266 type:complete len:411 (-) Transcript_37997:1463-2695(-)
MREGRPLPGAVRPRPRHDDGLQHHPRDGPHVGPHAVQRLARGVGLPRLRERRLGLPGAIRQLAEAAGGAAGARARGRRRRRRRRVRDGVQVLDLAPQQRQQHVHHAQHELGHARGDPGARLGAAVVLPELRGDVAHQRQRLVQELGAGAAAPERPSLERIAHGDAVERPRARQERAGRRHAVVRRRADPARVRRGAARLPRPLAHEVGHRRALAAGVNVNVAEELEAEVEHRGLPHLHLLDGAELDALLCRGDERRDGALPPEDAQERLGVLRAVADGQADAVDVRRPQLGRHRGARHGADHRRQRAGVLHRHVVHGAVALGLGVRRHAEIQEGGVVEEREGRRLVLRRGVGRRPVIRRQQLHEVRIGEQLDLRGQVAVQHEAVHHVLHELQQYVALLEGRARVLHEPPG